MNTVVITISGQLSAQSLPLGVDRVLALLFPNYPTNQRYTLPFHNKPSGTLILFDCSWKSSAQYNQARYNESYAILKAMYERQ